MSPLLKENIAKHVSLTEEETGQFCSLFVPKIFKRKEYFLREGQVCGYEGFVIRGLFRVYHADQNGLEPATIEHIKATAQKKLDVWGKNLGKAITSNVILPQVLQGNSLELEGQKLEIVGLDAFPTNTFVWIPSAKAIVGGINVFGNTFHLWMADAQTHEARTKWISVLDKIVALQPQTVIPAHSTSDAAFDLASVKYTKDYILFYEEALKKYKTSESLVKALKEQYPNAGFETALQLGAKVNTGEMKW